MFVYIYFYSYPRPISYAFYQLCSRYLFIYAIISVLFVFWVMLPSIASVYILKRLYMAHKA